MLLETRKGQIPEMAFAPVRAEIAVLVRLSCSSAIVRSLLGRRKMATIASQYNADQMLGGPTAGAGKAADAGSIWEGGTAVMVTASGIGRAGAISDAAAASALAISAIADARAETEDFGGTNAAGLPDGGRLETDCANAGMESAAAAAISNAGFMIDSPIA